MADASGPEVAPRLERSLNTPLKAIRLDGAEHEQPTTLLGKPGRTSAGLSEPWEKAMRGQDLPALLQVRDRGIGLQCFDPIEDYWGSRVHSLRGVA